MHKHHKAKQLILIRCKHSQLRARTGNPPLAEKIKAEVYVNQDKSLSDLQTLIKHSFLLYFPCELLMNFLRYIYIFMVLSLLAKRQK
jgi:hypothetical protein